MNGVVCGRNRIRLDDLDLDAARTVKPPFNQWGAGILRVGSAR